MAAATRTPTKAAASARRRREHHASQVRAASGRRQAWAVTAWLLAELKHVSAADRDAALTQLMSIARDLNERNSQ